MTAHRGRELPAAVLRHAFLIVMSGLFLVPIYIAVVNVFKTREDIFANPLSIPLSRLTFDNILRNINTPVSIWEPPTPHRWS